MKGDCEVYLCMYVSKYGFKNALINQQSYKLLTTEKRKVEKR